MPVCHRNLNRNIRLCLRAIFAMNTTPEWLLRLLSVSNSNTRGSSWGELMMTLCGNFIVEPRFLCSRHYLKDLVCRFWNPYNAVRPSLLPTPLRYQKLPETQEFWLNPKMSTRYIGQWKKLSWMTIFMII